MRKTISLLRDWLNGKSVDQDVDDELKFHLEQRAHSYEQQGFSPAESLALAAERFGDFERVKKQCIQITTQNSNGVWAMKIVFTLIFLLGVLIRTFTFDFRVTRIGNILMAIAVLGALLLYGRKLGTIKAKTDNDPIRLGLTSGVSSMPRSFDEQGRTPFDRVRVDDR